MLLVSVEDLEGAIDGANHLGRTGEAERRERAEAERREREERDRRDREEKERRDQDEKRRDG